MTDPASRFVRLCRDAIVGLLVIGACYFFLAPGRQPPPPADEATPGVLPDTASAPQAPGRPIDVVSTKEQALFEAARSQPPDPELAGLYADINARHFGGSLPAIPIVWQSLAEARTPLPGGQRLDGLTDGKAILINSEIHDDPADTLRTLCHEAVHVKLIVAGDTQAHHGELFQAELARVFHEGCFEAILASAEERATLKAWIVGESARLDAERARIDTTRTTLESDARDIRQAISDYNSRMTTANAQHAGWPSEDEAQALKARQVRSDERIAAFKIEVDRLNADSIQLNLEMRRHRLMLLYPYGIDEGTTDAPRRSPER